MDASSGTHAELKGHCPSLLHRLALPRVRIDASRLHHPVGIQRGCLCCGDASWLPLHSQGYITATSARPHTALYAVPFSSNKAGMPHGFLPGWGDASWMPPLFQGPHFLQNSPLLAQALSTCTAPPRAQRQQHIVGIEVTTRACSIEASDCDLRPFPDPSAPLGIEWWLGLKGPRQPPRANAKAPLALQHELEKVQRCTELGCITGTSTNVGMHRGYRSSVLCAFFQ